MSWLKFFSVPAAADLTHYAMVIVDGGTTRRQVYNLKADGQQKNNVLTIPINSTLVSFKDGMFDILMPPIIVLICHIRFAISCLQ